MLLYYDDPDLLDFDATVVAVRQRDGHPEVVLDRTAFYPEGGGQPADHGTIDGVPVIHVRKEGGEVAHVLGGPLSHTAAGTVVTAHVDGARRRDYRQQHTGQHILSAALMRVGGYETVSVHQGADYTTIEIAAAAIPPADLDAVERIANEAIEADLPVTATVVDESEIDRFPLRRPPKVTGSIRVVQVGDFDCVACGGVHLSRTGEARLIRAWSVENVRGHARIAWKIGDRAIDHYRLTSTIVSELGAALSAQPHELVDRVAKQEERARDAELANRQLRSRVYRLVAHSLVADAEPVRGRRVVTAEFDEEPKEFLRGVIEELVSQTGTAACLVNRSGSAVQWSIGIAPGSGAVFDRMRSELLPIIDGKGGGKPPIWQGVGTKPGAAQQFLARFTKLAETDPL